MADERGLMIEVWDYIDHKPLATLEADEVPIVGDRLLLDIDGDDQNIYSWWRVSDRVWIRRYKFHVAEGQERTRPPDRLVARIYVTKVKKEGEE